MIVTSDELNLLNNDPQQDTKWFLSQYPLSPCDLVCFHLPWNYTLELGTSPEEKLDWKTC